MTQGKTYILSFVATVMLLWTGCADNTYLGDQEEYAKGANRAIAFEGGFKVVTRADKVGADAATQLGNRFIIKGIKAKSDAPNADIRQDVFPDYIVNWTANSAGTTTTNTSGWEYTGINNAFISPTTEQTIKYWDFEQDYYNFAAYSVGSNTIEVKKDENSTNDGVTDGDAPAANTVFVTPFRYEHVTGYPYFLRGSKEDLLECYITDMMTVPQANFGNVVELRFRSLAAKVRVAFYETIPGFSVKDVRFYDSTGTSLDVEQTDAVTLATLFGTGGFIDSGTYKIFFPTMGSANVGNPDYNKAHAGHEGAQGAVNSQTFGMLNYSGRERLEPEGNYYLGRSSATATFAGKAEDDYYTKMLPFEEQTQTLELRVNYTLVSTDITGETITVYGAHAYIPSVFAKWKPNCAYTYIFKISDNQNGWTAPNIATPQGLFPITFDAVSLTDGDTGQQTTITTVASPSITTYQKGHIYNISEEYSLPSASTTDDDDIYAQVVDVASGNLKTDLNVAGKSKFYSVSKATATEAEVMDALNLRTSKEAETIVGVNGITLTPNTIDNTVTVIPGTNGDINVNAGEAAKLTPSAAGTYAYVYDTGAYYPVSTMILSSEPADWPTNYYTNEECTTPAPDTFAANTYYQRLKVFGVKVVKVKG